MLTLAEIVLRHELAHAYMAHCLGVVGEGVKVLVNGASVNGVAAAAPPYSLFELCTDDHINALVSLAGPLYSRHIGCAPGKDGGAMDYAMAEVSLRRLRPKGRAVTVEQAEAQCRALLLPHGGIVIEAIASSYLPAGTACCNISISGGVLAGLFQRHESKLPICNEPAAPRGPSLFD